jgi:TRAP transporter 4TM/12TM fusion protein
MPPRARTVVEVLYLIAAAGFLLRLLDYYVIGEGGPSLLAVFMVPWAFALFALDGLRTGGLYPRFGWQANALIAAIYAGACAAVGWYLFDEFEAIGTSRAGFWNATDMLAGTVMVLLVLEFARLRYGVLLVLNLVLILYAVYGHLVPGLFHHPGLSWERVASAMSVEMTTGVFSNLPQIALTLIGAFLLVLSLLRAFGCVDSILRLATRIAVRSPHALPQAAVIGSLGIAAVSGSSAANAATTGSATIPAMIGAGLPREDAAAIEGSASLGGQLMPPIMGISAFLMADFLGKSYFDVMLRGYAPAMVYFVGLSVAVYLLSVRARPKAVAGVVEVVNWVDGANLLAYGAVVFGLVLLMGLANLEPMIAAVAAFKYLGAALAALYLFVSWRQGLGFGWRRLLAPVRRFVEAFAGMTVELTLLLATLSIMTGAFVITGVPTKIGSVLMEVAGVHLILMIAVAFVFGAIVGTGLPPAPTYILTALVIVPPMIRVGVDPWVVHFFAFFLAVWGELTPPTSVVAAVAAKIADASFLKTLGRAIVLCVSLFVLMGGIFVRPELVVEPGLAQIATMLLFMVGTVGLTFALQASFAADRRADLAIRVALGALSLVAVLVRNDAVTAVSVAGVLGFVGWWIARRRAA